MSSGPNHRRGHGRVQERGPRWESHTPNAGCNSTHVARTRKWWRRYRHRAERRTGRPARGFHYSLLEMAPPKEEPPWSE